METFVKPVSKSIFYLNRIKNVLTAYFPKTDFTIRASELGHYISIDILYTDGVACSRLRDVVRVFSCPANPSINFKGVKINVQRAMSSKVKSMLLHEMKSVFRMKQLPEESDYFEPIRGSVGDYMQKIFKMRDFNNQ